MKKIKRNPFEIFGITPQLAKELSDETLYKIIKAIYRTLQLHYHPDRGGDPKKALELNLAFEAINYEKNPQAFIHYKKAYLQRLSRKTLKTELNILEQNLRKLTYHQELLKERFWQFLEKNFQYLKDLYREGFVLKVKLLDIISHINYSDYPGFKKKKQLFKELIFTPDTILKKAGINPKFILLKNYRLLGSVRRDYIEPWALMERTLKEEKFFLKDYLKKETFLKEIIMFLAPEIRGNSYLFFYHPSEPQKIYLEGLVLKLEEITQLEFLEILQKETIEGHEDERTQGLPPLDIPFPQHKD